MKVTYFTEVISSWCYWAEPAWADLKRRLAGRAEFEWKIALMDESGMPVSREQCDWFYRRSGTLMRSPFMLNSGWFEPGLKEYLAPNLVAEAGKDFGIHDDRIRLAISEAALREGRRIGDWSTSASVGARAAGLDPEKLLQRAQSPDVLARTRATTAEFHSLKITQRPTFVLESRIGDRAVVSGLARVEPLLALAEAMESDAAGYASFATHFGGPPKP